MKMGVGHDDKKMDQDIGTSGSERKTRCSKGTLSRWWRDVCTLVIVQHNVVSSHEPNKLPCVPLTSMASRITPQQQRLESDFLKQSTCHLPTYLPFIY